MKEPLLTRRMEPRWHIALAILVVHFFLVLLPERIRLLPSWAPLISATVSILPLVAVELTSGKAYWLKVERTVLLFLYVTILILTCVSLWQLVGFMLDRSGEKIGGRRLLASGLGVWIINVFSFSLLYWVIDRGGPGARANNVSATADWFFPNDNIRAENRPPGWQPFFVDYLFIGFCIATAFSTSDSLPLTRRAKLLVIIEITISLITMVVVLSRAIGIIRS